ncbi:MAG: glycoside hydrolase family 97 protein, partial [Ignavibacteria bacterium]|nr:glycoside hydrolase family 97 protein [Ignavibacteria bacterium]
MKKMIFTFFLLFLGSLLPQTIFSPNGNLSLSFNLTAEGKLFYQLSFKGKQIIKPSALGIMLKDAPSFDKNFEIIKVDTQTFDESWNPVWGE